MAFTDFITSSPYWDKLVPPSEVVLPPWSLSDLPPLLVGDCFAFRVDPGWAQWVVHFNGAVTWHWALAGMDLPADPVGGPYDQQIVGSISKGIATELLSTYQHRPMRVYRPKLDTGVQESLQIALLKRYGHYGAYNYNMIAVEEAPLDYLLRGRGIHVPTPMGNRFYCVQFCAQVWSDLGYPLCDMTHSVTQRDLETSPMLEQVWGNF